jgi:AcrR family transcriptional regulator
MPRTGRPRGEYAKTAQRRREILDASLEVFAGSGFRSGSLREIADRVGMSQAGLLHHFPSKTHLLMAVLEERDEQARKRSGDALHGGVSTVRAFVDNARCNATVPGLVELFCILSAEATAPDHPAHEYFQQRYRWVLGTLIDALGKARADGDLRSDVEPSSTARALVALQDGLQVQWLLDPDGVDIAEELEAYVRPMLTVDL